MSASEMAPRNNELQRTRPGFGWSLAAIRRHPYRSIWVGAQLAVVGYGEWATRFGGADYHIGFLLLPIMGVLLFPGVIVPYVAAAIGFFVLERLPGGPYYVTNKFAGMSIGLVVWAISGVLSDIFWRRVAFRMKSGGVKEADH